MCVWERSGGRGDGRGWERREGEGKRGKGGEGGRGTNKQTNKQERMLEDPELGGEGKKKSVSQLKQSKCVLLLSGRGLCG